MKSTTSKLKDHPVMITVGCFAAILGLLSAVWSADDRYAKARDMEHMKSSMDSSSMQTKLQISRSEMVGQRQVLMLHKATLQDSLLQVHAKRPQSTQDHVMAARYETRLRQASEDLVALDSDLRELERSIRASNGEMVPVVRTPRLASMADSTFEDFSVMEQVRPPARAIVEAGQAMMAEAASAAAAGVEDASQPLDAVEELRVPNYTRPLVVAERSPSDPVNPTTSTDSRPAQ